MFNNISIDIITIYANNPNRVNEIKVSNVNNENKTVKVKEKYGCPQPTRNNTTNENK